MNILNNQKLITCILPKGIGHKVLLQLKQQKGILTANLNSARGGGSSYMEEYAKGQLTEKDLLNVVVPADTADEVFNFIHAVAGIGQSHGGFIFITKLKRSTLYVLPTNLSQEE